MRSISILPERKKNIETRVQFNTKQTENWQQRVQAKIIMIGLEEMSLGVWEFRVSHLSATMGPWNVTTTEIWLYVLLHLILWVNVKRTITISIQKNIFIEGRLCTRSWNKNSFTDFFTHFLFYIHTLNFKCASYNSGYLDMIERHTNR